MSQPAVPSDGYITNNARTTAEVKTEFDSFLNVLRAVLGGGPEQTIALLVGSADPTIPASVIKVTTEGGAPVDDLYRVNGSLHADGAFIWIEAGDSNLVTINHTITGNWPLQTGDAANVDLLPGVRVCFQLRSGTWYEVQRSYETAAAWRDRLGLGTAALLDDGTLDAATLEGRVASQFLAVDARAANSALFDGEPISDFIRSDIAAQQTVLDAFQCGGRALVAAALGLSAGIEFFIDANQRCEIFLDDSDGYATIRVRNAGGAIVAGIRFVDTTKAYEWWDGTSWSSVIDATHLGGAPASSYLQSSFLTNSIVGSVSNQNAVDVALNRRSFWPDITSERFGSAAHLEMTSRYALSASYLNPGFRLYNAATAGGDVFYRLSWEYMT